VAVDGTDEEIVQRARARLGNVLRGKYRLDRVLGIGGMATVYAATHRNGNEFAVKVLHPDLSMRADLRNRFLREGQAAGTVKHPGAVQILDDDVGEDGSAFLVMELLHGDSVEVLWERRHQRLPLALVVGIGLQLLDVLQAAHGRGVIHRDIKPANLFLTRTGQVKVLDFGIARIRDLVTSHATQTGMMMGTPAFMSPEQAMAKTSDIDAQTDVWSAGATLFTLASGTLVHEADNAQQIMIRAATTQAPSLASVLPECPADIAAVIDRALAFEKADRWADAGAMRSALEEVATAAFGSVPNAAGLADIIEELGEEATVVQQFDVPPPHPGLQRHAVGLSIDEVTAPVARYESKPEVTLRLASTPAPSAGRMIGPPATELATAQPVSRDSPRAPSRLGRWLRPGVVLAALGSIAAAAALIVVVLVLARHTSGPTSTTTAASSGTMSAPSATVEAPPTATASAAPLVPLVATEQPAASVQEVPIDELPTAAPSPQQPAASRPTHTPATASSSAGTSKPNCNPPFTFDAQGNRKWKRECVR
jgi:serine/threonine protein kinase